MKSFRLEESSEPGGKDSARRPHTRLLVFLVVLFALATVALAIVLAYTVLKVDNLDDNKDTPCPEVTAGGQSPHQQVVCPTAKPANDDVCLTEGCVLAAARLRGAMDPSINPCDDFYNFACGTWLKQHVIPEDKGSFGTFTKLRDDVSVILKAVLEAKNVHSDPEAVRKARNFYDMCMNDTQIEQLGLAGIHDYMTGLMGWPVMGSNLGGHWNASMDLEDLMILVRRGTNSLPVIDFGVTQDDKNPEHHILAMDQPSLYMPSRDYYLKPRDDKAIMAYQTLIQEFAVALGADETTAAKDAKDVVDMEIEIANITVRREDRRDPEKLYNKMTLRDLTTTYPGVQWLKLINGVFSLTGETITDSEPIIVMAPDYFAKLGNILQRYDKRTIVNYIVGSRVMEKSFYLPAVFTEIKLRYKKVVSGTAKQPPRWQSCSSGAKSYMPEVVGRLFVKEAFKKEAKTDVLDLVDKLRIAFKEMIDELDWMGPATKLTAKEKADAVDPRIGYPDIVYNDTALNDKYHDVTISGDNPLDTVVSIGNAAVVRQLKKLRKPYDYSEWGMAAATVNAYYDPETNQITFPAAILQPPFYTKDQPAYLNYGGIGYVIGHEITHGFDDQGRLYDKTGHLKAWWTDSDNTKFKKKAQCIIDQYSNFTVEGTGGMTLNGVTTQGENIADNGGIKESFRAYRKWVAARGQEEKRLPGLSYNSNQLYFLNAAQIWCAEYRIESKIKSIRKSNHPISQYRVYGPMQNFDEFSKAWNCPLGSFMNKRNKCAVW